MTSLTPNLGDNAPSDSNGTMDELLDVRVPTVSGFYIELAEQGKLRELEELHRRRQWLKRQVADTEEKLLQINDREFLMTFGRTRHNFPAAVRERAAKLEELKRNQSIQLSEVEASIARIDPHVLELAVPSAGSSRDASGGLREMSNAQKRDRMIRKLADTSKSDLQICIALDFELQKGDAAPIGIPPSWVEDYGERWRRKCEWRFYEAAYKDPETKNRMQKMISVAKRK